MIFLLTGSLEKKSDALVDHDLDQARSRESVMDWIPFQFTVDVLGLRPPYEWAGHVARRVDDERWSWKVLMWIPNGTRRREHQVKHW